ncbi:MAG: glycosyltransferase family 10 [Crocinitomicaceae bacterium]
MSEKELIKVLVSRSYSFPDFKRQTPGNSGVWNNIQLVENTSEEVDFILILNQPGQNINTKAYEGGRWLFLQEPPYARNEYFKYHFRFVDKVISGFGDDISINEQAQAALPWHVNKNYDELVNLRVDQIQKQNRVSWITSNNNIFPGHQPRIDFINYLNQISFDYDLFGRGFQPIDDKFDGIAPYKYSIAVENYSAKDYWTEKAIDCMLSWTIPLYFGCTNMGDYFPKGSFIELDITDKKKAADQIKNILASDHWEQNLEALKEARELILNKYQMFPELERRISDFKKQNPHAKKKNFYIPKSGLTRSESLKKKIKNILGS